MRGSWARCRWALALGMITMCALAACQGAGAARGEQRQTLGSADDAAMPQAGLADTLKGGCSGGVTGGGGGVAVTGSGEVLEWKQTLATQPTAFTTVRIDSAAAAEVFAEVERTRFRSVVHVNPSNVTCFLTLTDSLGKHTVAWPMGDAPAAVRELDRRLHSLVRR